jgi:outer membrane protein assembly factor BamB
MGKTGWFAFSVGVSLLVSLLVACDSGLAGKITLIPIALPSLTATAGAPTSPAPDPTRTLFSTSWTATPLVMLTPVPRPTGTSVSIPSTQMGWTAKHGGPNSARANLTAKLHLPLKLAWEWKKETDSPQAIVIEDGQVFLLTTRGQFCILDARTGASKTCSPIWPDVKGASGTKGQIALSGDTVVVSALEIYIKPGDRYGSARSRLVAFSLDGQPRWALPPIENQGGEAIAFGNGIVVSAIRRGIDENLLTSFDAANGMQHWQIPGFFNHGASNGTNFYTDDKNTAAWRLSTGERVWVQTTDAKHVLYAQGRLFAVGDHTVAGLDAATGKLLWKMDFGVFPLTDDQVGVAAAHNHLYITPVPGETRHGFRPGVIALDAATGKEVWSALLDPRDEQSAEHIAATSDSLVVVGTEFSDAILKRLWVINAQSGAEVDRVIISNDFMTWQPSGLAVADDQVYVLGPTLRVYGPSQPGR